VINLRFLKSLIPYIIIITIVVIVRTYIVTPVRVNGTSMYPTLNGGEIMLLNKLGKIERNKIVVLKLERDKENLIKRVIGLPGETIEIHNNKIFINGEEFPDPYGDGYTFSHNFTELTLGDDEYLVLGDNRENSLDSRVLGAIKKQDIKGTTNFIMYPFRNFGKVE